jgi:uncharacterized membrane protein
VVSNILENTSILTGSPFGHHHYTDALGPKLFLVPLLIGPAYFANGYFAWVIGNLVVGELRRGSSTFLTVAGVVWQTRSIAESIATVSIFTMLFAVAMSAVKLLQVGSNVPKKSGVRLNPPAGVLVGAIK